jgi:hypothetical protein
MDFDLPPRSRMAAKFLDADQDEIVRQPAQSGQTLKVRFSSKNC